MRPRSGALALGGALLLSACLVPRVDHRAEISRVRALEHDRDLDEEQIADLDLRVRDLARTGENLELERTALDEERVELLNELEDVRVGNLALQEQLTEERDVRLNREAELAAITGTYRNLVDELEGEIEAGQIEIHRLRGRLQVRALDRILFDSGRTEIKPEGREVIASVATQILKLPPHHVRVEGHTDNVPISTERFPSNWELASARAVTVLRFLIEQGLPPDRLSAAGFGPHQPIGDNASAAGRSRNRRIEIVLVPQDEDGGSANVGD